MKTNFLMIYSELFSYNSVDVKIHKSQKAKIDDQKCYIEAE
jgi:hypothetical protein